MNDRLVKL